MNFSPKKQQGLTMISIVMIVIGICAVALLVLQILPVYMSHGKVKSAIESIATLPDVEFKSKNEIQSLLNKRFTVNSIDSDILPKDAIKITKHGAYLKIQAKYDVKKPIVGNISVLIEFDDFIEVGA